MISQHEVCSRPITITGERIIRILLTNAGKTILYVVLSLELELYVLQLIQMKKTRPTVLNSEAEAALDHQIQNFLSPDILVESHHESTKFISPFFLRKKKSGVSE